MLGVVYLTLGRAQLAVAVPPPNDDCAGAEVVPSAGPFPYLTMVVDVKDAASTNDPPTPSCAVVSVARGVWYRFTAPSTALYTLSCSGDTATTVQDTVMAIYTSSNPTNGCSGSYAELDCNDDEGNLQSAISRTLTSNVTYYVVVWMSSVSPPLAGKTFVQLRVTQPVPPANDTCAGAEMIPGSGPFPYLTAVTDTTRATNSTGDPTPSCWSPRIRSVWYHFTPDVTASYELTLCTNTATSIYETLLAVYTSSSGCAGPFAQIACNHTNPCGNKLRSTINATLTNGLTYYLVAWEGDMDPYIPGETSLQLRVARFLPPIVTTSPATSIASTGAVLNAVINPNGLATSAWFEWGATTDYGNNTATQNPGGGTNNVSLASPLSGLSAGATYHYRARATNSIGAAVGVDRSFNWSGARPNFSSFVSSSNGMFALQFTGAAGQTYLVQASTNLLNWGVIGTATDNGNGIFSFADANSGGFRSRFYRVLAP